MRALALALSWLTVLPVRTGAPDARTAAGAIRWAPVVGGLLGAAAGGVLLGLTALGVAPLVAGLLAVGFLGLATRGMHLDGLADTADGLGCYGPPERALAVMRDGGAGPFGVVALVVAVGVQAAALAAHPWLDAAIGPGGGPWPALALVGSTALAAAAGRAGFGWVCRRGIPAARPGGLGATVAGSQPAWVPVLWWLALAVAGSALAGVRGVVAVALGAVLVALLSWHTARRFGGMTGDVLGAATELATTAALVVLVSGP
ncbi:adenosylcobinamide-GDP ribazoletransferase [Pseudonocardia petroleophila]|uniref:Adenosylcobinamide-GDP ribazoletransferase n=1 Tax=Pseudonocardia petroleophila TaxID=37331 RepID=A0A7G7MBD8_9PSEU|nr:adenosylcobinamide-GDP ribazoletransferase [Pseudonocardia petroleophila]QNG50099.1 adenosylcobinamide-GDP ribazoletransferase [Pseudonocardia petroleophila]